MEKFIITISGLSREERESIKQLESRNCKIISTAGFDGIVQDVITIFCEDSIARAVVVEVISGILLKIGEHAWKKCKVNFKFSNGRNLVNIARKNFETLKEWFKDEQD